MHIVLLVGRGIIILSSQLLHGRRYTIVGYDCTPIKGYYRLHGTPIVEACDSTVYYGERSALYNLTLLYRTNCNLIKLHKAVATSKLIK